MLTVAGWPLGLAHQRVEAPTQPSLGDLDPNLGKLGYHEDRQMPLT